MSFSEIAQQIQDDLLQMQDLSQVEEKVQLRTADASALGAYRLVPYVGQLGARS